MDVSAPRFAFGALGLVCGLLAASAADVLPARHDVWPRTGARVRRVRYAAAIAVCAGWAITFGERVVASPRLADWFAVVISTVLAAVLVAATAIDLEHMILPNELTFGGAALAIVTAPIGADGSSASLLRAGAGAAVGFAAAVLPHLVYRAVRRRSAMGLGDAKLLVFVGAWLGPAAVLVALFVGAAASVVVAGVLRALGVRVVAPASVRRELEELRMRAATGDAEAREALGDDPMAEDLGDGLLETRLPFGPFLASGAFFAALAPRAVDAALTWVAGG